jgi:cytochrome c1
MSCHRIRAPTSVAGQVADFTRCPATEFRCPGRLAGVIPRVLVTALLAVGMFAACGSDDGGAPPDLNLSPAGEAGWQTTRAKGCAACHGSAGEGGVGPAFAGLYGSEVPLQDGTTVLADDTYLERSINDPNADKVEGYNLPMPQSNLSDAEIASILDYLREIGA